MSVEQRAQAEKWMQDAQYSNDGLVGSVANLLALLATERQEKERLRNVGAVYFQQTSENAERARCAESALEAAQQARQEAEQKLAQMSKKDYADWAHIEQEARKAGIGYDKAANGPESALYAIRSLASLRAEVQRVSEEIGAEAAECRKASGVPCQSEYTWHADTYEGWAARLASLASPTEGAGE
jgi:membrane-associated HD superfamily phosphohydrolase